MSGLFVFLVLIPDAGEAGPAQNNGRSPAWPALEWGRGGQGGTTSGQGLSQARRDPFLLLLPFQMPLPVLGAWTVP